MGENSKIEWTHHTINLWWGCTHVHSGCDHCYAESTSKWRGFSVWGDDAGRRRIKSAFTDIDKFQRLAASKNEYHRVFIGSMMDLFEKSMPLLNPIDHYTETGNLRQELFTRIGMGLYPNLILLLLTKRPSNIPKMIPAGWLDEPPDNVMYGTSASDQETFYNMVKHLLRVPGKHFVSVEPQLRFIDINCLNALELGQKISWLIQGGESGHHKRPFDLEWAYSMRDQCARRGIAYFFKQIDKVLPIPPGLVIRQFPELKKPQDHPS